VNGVVPLAEARDTAVYGSKAVGLGDALRDGLRVPPGVALSGPVVEAVAGGDETTIGEVREAVRTLAQPFAVRSSAVDEDGNEASFAGQHQTLLNVQSADEVSSALREIWWSANSDSAITYRQRVGLFARPIVGVVVQSLLDPDAAGVMFTTNPITGADERVIEASWGLGEAVVAGLVIPDHFRLDRSGAVLERSAGDKRLRIRRQQGGGTAQEAVPTELVSSLCLTDDQLGELAELASRCEKVYGPDRDIEFAFAGGALYLLQCRAITSGNTGKPGGGPQRAADPVEAVQRVHLFAGLDRQEIEQITSLLKERRFAAGETVIREGSAGAALFIIESGLAEVSVRGTRVASLGPGEYFGEIALIDEGPRAATVTATTELVCQGLTLWEFRPLVQQNGVIGWKLLQSLVRALRQAERPPSAVPPAATPAPG